MVDGDILPYYRQRPRLWRIRGFSAAASRLHRRLGHEVPCPRAHRPPGEVLFEYIGNRRVEPLFKLVNRSDPSEVPFDFALDEVNPREPEGSHVAIVTWRRG